jgi:hypothetical protein
VKAAHATLAATSVVHADRKRVRKPAREVAMCVCVVVAMVSSLLNRTSESKATCTRWREAITAFISGQHTCDMALLRLEMARNG